MDDSTPRNANQVSLGQEQYEDLQHVFAAHGYRKSVLVDAGDVLDGVYKLERWTADGGPTILVTVGDNHLIELWGSTELWGDGFPRDSGKLAGYVDDLLTARRGGRRSG